MKGDPTHQVIVDHVDRVRHHYPMTVTWAVVMLILFAVLGIVTNFMGPLLNSPLL